MAGVIGAALARSLAAETLLARAWRPAVVAVLASPAPGGNAPTSILKTVSECAGAFYARGGFREVGRVTYRKVPHIYFEVLV